MSHEQSETIQGRDKQFYNVYGKGTGADQPMPLPRVGSFEQRSYPTSEMASNRAAWRSQLGHGQYPTEAPQYGFPSQIPQVQQMNNDTPGYGFGGKAGDKRIHKPGSAQWLQNTPPAQSPAYQQESMVGPMYGFPGAQHSYQPGPQPLLGTPLDQLKGMDSRGTNQGAADAKRDDPPLGVPKTNDPISVKPSEQRKVRKAQRGPMWGFSNAPITS